MPSEIVSAAGGEQSQVGEEAHPPGAAEVDEDQHADRAEGAEQRHLRKFEHLEADREGGGDDDRRADRVLQRVIDRGRRSPASPGEHTSAVDGCPGFDPERTAAAAGTTPANGGKTAWARNLATPVRDFLGTETGSALVLVGAVIVALLWANVDFGSYTELWDDPPLDPGRLARHRQRPARRGSTRG